MYEEIVSLRGQESMPLPRLQLFEFGDLTWFPHSIRDFTTDYLHFMEARFALHKPIVPLLQAMLESSEMSCVVDLCSGGGGPVLAVYEALVADQIHVEFTLTDKFPNGPAFQRLSARYPLDIRYIASAVDATDVSEELVGVRTMFNAFHHFAPGPARLVLESAVRAHQPIGIFETPERTFRMLIPFLFIPIYVLLATFFIRPFRWKRLLWTYLVPMVPLTCWWDGLVSVCRAYTVAEMLTMTQGLDDYDWKAGRAGHGNAGTVTYLLGIPRSRSGIR
jgi:hypothetical protein